MILTMCIATFDVTAGNDSVSVHIDSVTTEKLREKQPVKGLTDSTYSQRHPVPAAVLSLVLPGAGQVYNKRKVKGAMVLAGEAIMVGYAINRSNATKNPEKVWNFYRGQAHSLSEQYRNKQLAMPIEEYIDTLAGLYIKADSVRYNYVRLRTELSYSLCWAGGLYVYACMDAIDKTGWFKNNDKKDPRKAGLLSAIPGLGLGQLYNGELAKAGRTWMVQTALAWLSIRNYSLMKQSERQLDYFQDPAYLHSAYTHRESYERFWENKRREHFRDWNTYLWYSIFYYFYNIFEAVADAHLHDFKNQIQLEPDLQPRDLKLDVTLNFTF